MHCTGLYKIDEVLLDSLSLENFDIRTYLNSFLILLSSILPIGLQYMVGDGKVTLYSTGT